MQKPLLHGYVIAVATNPEGLYRLIERISGFARLITLGDSFVPLRDDERIWIGEFTNRDNRVAPISVGYREGDTLIVTEGPLRGREAMIKRIIARSV